MACLNEKQLMLNLSFNRFAKVDLAGTFSCGQFVVVGCVCVVCVCL